MWKYSYINEVSYINDTIRIEFYKRFCLFILVFICTVIKKKTVTGVSSVTYEDSSNVWVKPLVI